MSCHLHLGAILIIIEGLLTFYFPFLLCVCVSDF